jgi:hypothetical protein
MPVIEDLGPITAKVGDALVDAGDLALDAAFGSPDSSSAGGRRLLRAVFVLMIVSAIAGAIIWRRRAAQDQAPEASPTV